MSNTIYGYPYKIEGDVLTVTNKDHYKDQSSWETVTLQPRDCMTLFKTKNGSNVFPPIHWTGKSMGIYNSGPTSLQSFHDHRVRCVHCGNVACEGDHTKCLIEGGCHDV